MKNHIQTRADHWAKILIFAVFVMSTKIHGQDMVDVTFIQDAVAKGAVCLDGSPAYYHYSKGSGDGFNKWILYLEGGGWCRKPQECLQRSTEKLGSSKFAHSTFFGGVLSSRQDTNPDFYNWNKVYLRYCDGASFLADIEAVDPETKLYLRGGRIFRATVEEMLAKGMSSATGAILMGNSAGGLATILNCDRFRALVPNIGNVKCISDSGFFLHGKSLPGADARANLYRNVTAFHQIANVLPTSCTSRMDPALCLLPENVIGDIQTPLFILNSDFDAYQIAVALAPPPGLAQDWKTCVHNLSECTADQLLFIKEFRLAFLETLNEIRDNPSRGMYINSCYIHDMLYKTVNWSKTPKIEDKTISKAIGDWYFNRNYVRLIDTHNDSPINCDT